MASGPRGSARSKLGEREPRSCGEPALCDCETGETGEGPAEVLPPRRFKICAA